MKPWLLLPPKWAHALLPWALSVLCFFLKNKNLEFKKFTWRGLTFKNPIGIAGGVDKTAFNLLHWQKLGVGFLEIGTVTPLPQGPNPGRIVARDIATQSVWNKMGFPNPGAISVLNTLIKKQKHLNVPLFVNVGKNRSTSNEQAAFDYISCLQTFKSIADVFVINISSPNTQGLRQLLQPVYFRDFLNPILNFKKTENLQQPLLLKLSPDMTDSELSNVLDISLELNIDGWIVTNTTTDRQSTPFFSTEGGVSGAPLAERSKYILKYCAEHLKNKKQDRLLISAGGITTANDVHERLKLGADLVQMYSALIFHGPFHIANCLNDLQLSHGPA